MIEIRGNATDAIRKFQHYIDTYTEQPNWTKYDKMMFVRDVIYGLGIAIDSDEFEYYPGYLQFCHALRSICDQEIQRLEAAKEDVTP